MTLFATTPLAAPSFGTVVAAAAGRPAPDPSLREAFVTGGAPGQLDRLFAPDALCVTTGQQPGLLTGPLYTMYKAVAAIAYARRAERELERPVVPVFWVAGDDHDFAEANHLYVLTTGNAVERVGLPDRPPEAPLTPMYRQPVGDTIADVFERLVAVTPDTEFRGALLDTLHGFYTPAADLATAFAETMAHLLGAHGLVVFRPTHAAAKRLMRPWILRTIEEAAEVDAALGTHAEALRAAGQPTPVAVGNGATPVMLEGTAGRDRLVVDDGTLHARRSGERYDVAALHALADEHPERFSPNVLLRPVIEAAILPTIAYVAGPGELAYLPQCAPLYERLGVRPQTPVARWSARVMESRVTKVLIKYAVAADDLALPEGQLEQRLVRDEMPAEARAALGALRQTLQREYARLREAAVGIDPTLKKPVESAQRAALGGVNDAEHRLLSHLKRNNDVLVQQLEKARRSIFPTGKPQERVLNVVPFLIRYGDAFLDDALREAEAWVSTLEPTPGTP